MSRIRIGVQLHQQHTSFAEFADAVRRVEDLGVDTIWNWDHFVAPVRRLLDWRSAQG